MDPSHPHALMLRLQTAVAAVHVEALTIGERVAAGDLSAMAEADALAKLLERR